MQTLNGKSHIMYPILLVAIALVLSIILSKTPESIKLPWFKNKQADNNFFVTFPRSPTKVKIPILLYHYVEVVTDERDFIRKSLSITPIEFEKQIISLKTAGYRFYNIKDLEVLLNTEYMSGKPVMITFDDGYGDFYTDAYPVLKRQNVKATVFINSGLMGKLNYMTVSQIEEILKSGLIEIGGHGYSHQSLTEIDVETANKVISDDVSAIKSEYGLAPVSFAYPYGYYNDAVVNMVKEAGYKYGVTLTDGYVVQSDKLFYLPRIRPGRAQGNDLGEYLNSLKI